MGEIVVEHAIVPANGERFYVASAGPASGPPVLLLHGFPEMSYGWRHQLAPLGAAGLRAIAPDQRGYGLSTKPQGPAAYTLDVLAADIVALARQLGHSSVRLVGHDWGGLVAWHLATNHPGFVERAAILNAPHPATMLGYLFERPVQAIRSAYIGFFQLPWLPEALLAAGDFAMLRRALTSTSRPGTFTEAELTTYREAWTMEGALTAMLDWYRALPSGPSLGDKRVEVPVRIIWGDRDAALNAELAERALARCDRGELFHLADATHWLHHEEPARVNELLVEFLR